MDAMNGCNLMDLIVMLLHIILSKKSIELINLQIALNFQLRVLNLYFLSFIVIVSAAD